MIRSPRAVGVITFRSQTAMDHPEEPDPAPSGAGERRVDEGSPLGSNLIPGTQPEPDFVGATASGLRLRVEGEGTRTLEPLDRQASSACS
jgi:hypothetical protein